MKWSHPDASALEAIDSSRFHRGHGLAGALYSLKTPPSLLGFVAISAPEVESPIPESIGLDFPFTLAGVGALLGLFYSIGRTDKDRERLVRWWTLSFLAGGALIYLILLAIQLLSS